MVCSWSQFGSRLEAALSRAAGSSTADDQAVKRAVTGKAAATLVQLTTAWLIPTV